jgi:erythronate-4-phosphate dehydrogenase
VTLHVPLTVDGPDATLHLLDRARVARLRTGAVVLNCSRGAVADGAALAEARLDGRIRGLALDVFEGEPEPPPSVVEATDLATPHIAGHSIDGKAAGTLAVYRAACAHLGVAPKWTPRRELPAPPVKVMALDTRTLTDEAAALLALRRFYRIEDDDAAMRRIARLPSGERGPAFRRYREGYPARREPVDLRLELRPPRPRAAALLECLGATITDIAED